MKTAPFRYVRPVEAAHALEVLAEEADEAKVLAGGQSLVPMMNFRLARPSVLVDINRLTEIRGVSRQANTLTIGATTRHLELQNLSGSDALANLIRRAAVHIGHLPIRTRGTFGGSLAHGDATSEWCLVARLLDAEMCVASRDRGTRTVAAADFFQSLFVTSLLPDELLTEIRLPVLGERDRTGFVEFARRAGDFAVVSIGVVVEVDDGKVSAARICIGGVAEAPHRASDAETALVGITWDGSKSSTDRVAHVAATAAAELSPQDDIHGPAEYRRDLVRALLPRALSQALDSKVTN